MAFSALAGSFLRSVSIRSAQQVRRTEVGINWRENGPWLSAEAGREPAPRKSVRGEVDDGDADGKLRKENRRLRDRISELESGQ